MLTVVRVALRLAVIGVSATASAQNARLAAERDSGIRIVVSIGERRLRVIDGIRDTLLVARVAVGSGDVISYGGHRWQFDTPRGIRTVVSKDSAPVWIPPDWHYIEVARREHLKIVWLLDDTTIAYDDGVMYVPPVGSENRRVPGELGEFRLSTGDGIGIHGTRDKASIGNAVTHGCMRLSDEDLAWVYHHVPVGAKVYIY